MRLVLGQRSVQPAGSTPGKERRVAYRGRFVTFSFVAGLLALAVFASAASAASKQVISDFGTHYESGSLGGELNNPRDVAVNGTGSGPANAGDTYVADEANNRIERFDSAGNFVSAWGEDTIATSVNERQRLVVEATSGTFTLTFNGSTTAPIASESASYLIREKLEALPSVGGGNVEVSGEGTAANPFVVTFTGALAGAGQPQLSVDTGQLNGTAEVTTIVDGTSTTSHTGAGFEICTIAAECKAGTASGKNGALESPQSVAVDQDSGNVYVSDRGNRRVDEYDGAGNFIRAFGFDVAESGPGDTGTGYEVCNEAQGDVCKAGVAGSGAGQYGEGSAELGFGIAFSAADGNATSGTVYLADSGNRRVDTFKLDGTNPGSFGSATQFGEEQPRSVAVDSRGIVYASDSNNGGDVQRYDSANVDGGGVGFLAPILPSQNEQQEITFTGFSTGDNFKLSCPNGTQTEKLTYASGEIGTTIIRHGLEEACGAGDFSVSGETPTVTVTFTGALGGADQPQMTCSSLGGSGTCSVTTISAGRAGPLLPGNPSSATAGLAVNAAGTTLYVLRVPTPGPIVVEQLGPVHEPGLTSPPSAADEIDGAAAKFESAVHGFGFDEAGGSFYVAVNGDPDGYEYEGHPAPLPYANRVYVLADSSSLPSPTVSTPTVGDTAARNVTFHDEVDPRGGIVSCSFEYSTDETKWTAVSVPGCAALNQNGGAQDIGKFVSGLAPNTQYAVRLQVTRPYFTGYTPVTSAVQSFTTATSAPTISAASAKAIDEGSVRVTATINPSHSPTTYVIHYGTSPALGSSTAPVSLGSGTEPVEISPVIGGLTAATKYYFKVVATNGVASAESETLTATTFSGSSGSGSCPNELLRTGPSAKLPDCRAYEQATPMDKFGSDAYGGPSTVEASESGDGITSYTFSGFPNSEGFQYANNFVSRFVDGEWSTNGLNTPPKYGDVSEVFAWTPDLRLTFARVFDITNGFGSGYSLVMRDSTDGSRTVVFPATKGVNEITIGGAFDGDSKVVFATEGSVAVTSGPAPASTSENVYLYDRDTGELTLAGLLPNSACANAPCVPSEGTKLAAAFHDYVQPGHAVSASGDIYFTDTKTGGLYVRHDAGKPDATTALISASHKTNGGGSGGVATNSPQPAQFAGATPDGSKAFFTSTEELTNEANTGPEPLLTPSIGRANIDGTGVERNLIPVTAKWTAVDSSHVYWANTAAGTIGRANIDGSNAEPNFLTGLENPEGIAVDSGHIFWAEARNHEEGQGTIARATLAGGGVEKGFITGVSDPHGVAVSGGYLYWTGLQGIGRATPAGANVEQTFIFRGNATIALAANASHLYFTQKEGGFSLFEYTLNGEYAESEQLQETPGDLAADSGHLYLSSPSTTRIFRKSLNLRSTEPNFITSVNGVFGIAADSGHIYWASDPDPSTRPASPGNDLYRYDAAAGELLDLTPDSSDPIGADVVGTVGYSNDGSYAYFVANADLDGSGPAQPGHCISTTIFYGFEGSCSIYLWRADGAGPCVTTGGCISFVAPVDADGFTGISDWLDWAGEGENELKTSRVSADGRTLVFRSQLELTGYDNVPADKSCGEEFGSGRTFPCAQFFRYDSTSGQVSCLTCSPVGAPPNHAPDLKNPDLFHAPTSHAVTNAQASLSRNLSADGKRFFFESSDKLVPGDVNGDVSCPSSKETERGVGPSCRDVYEWEAPGAGSCTTDSGSFSPASGGCIYLLSPGSGLYPTYLADESESGDTVFLFSRQQLVPSDEDNIEDIYAVKVDGGLASQNTPRPAPCEGDGCRGASSEPPNVPGAGSGVFEGPANPKQSSNQTRCPKGKRTVHRKGKVRCVAKHKKHGTKKNGKSKHKKHGSQKRAANSDRRTSR